MVVQVTKYINVRERAVALGYTIPTEIVLLPMNFDEAESADELLDATDASTVQKILREANIPATRIEKNGTKLRTSSPKASEWIAPLIFIGAHLLHENPEAPKIVLDTLFEYLRGHFRGFVGNKQTKIQLIVEKKGDFVKAAYEGPFEGASELYNTVKQISED